MHFHFQLFQCVICLEQFTQVNPPLLFQCGHTFCQSCVIKKFHVKKFTKNGIQKNRCIVDRTHEIENQIGRKNKNLLNVINQAANQGFIVWDKVKAQQENIVKLRIENMNLKKDVQELSDKIPELTQQFNMQKDQINEKYKIFQQQIKQATKQKRLALLNQIELKKRQNGIISEQVKDLIIVSKQLQKLKSKYLKNKIQQQMKQKVQQLMSDDDDQQQSKKKNKKSKRKNKQTKKYNK